MQFGIVVFLLTFVLILHEFDACIIYRLNNGHGCSINEHIVNCTSKCLHQVPIYHTLRENITIFYLQINIIKILKNNSFNATPNALKIDLSLNQLKEDNIERDAFAGLHQLEELNLERNSFLKRIDSHWFSTLNFLRNVSFAYSSIKEVSGDAFVGCTSLEEIHFEHNEITNVPNSLFRNLLYLRNVYVHANRIYRLPNQIFRNSTSIEVFWFERNQMETIQETSGLKELGNLKELSIGGNKYRCDCKILWFSKWVNDPGNITFLTKVNATCSEDGTNITDVAHRLKYCDLDIMTVIIASCATFLVIVLVARIVFACRWNIRYWNQLRLRRKQYERIENGDVDRGHFKYDAYVSYHSHDLDWVLKTLHPKLEGPDFNFRLCLDYRDFIVGDSVVNNITEAVKLSRKTIILVTDNYARSELCYFELEMARLRMLEKQEDPLIFIQLLSVSPESMSVLLKKEMSSEKCIKWPSCENGQKVFWVKLGMALRSPNISRRHTHIMNVTL